MAVKYIQKNKNGLWAISNSKSGKTIRTTNTQKEAIAIAGSTKTTEGIMIKRSSGWGAATGWDQSIANSTKSKTTRKEDRIQKTEWADKPAPKKAQAKKTTTKKTVAKKAPVKKAAPKKAAPKKAVAKKTAAKKAPVKKAAPKKVAAAKPEAKKRQTQKIEVLKVETKENQKHKKGLPAWAGLLIGLSIIATVVGGAFLLGYFL